MVLCKVVKSVPVPNTDGTATHTLGWYLVENGLSVKVELWEVYTPRPCKTEEEQEKENAKCRLKQNDNWRKLSMMPYKTCEGYEDLKEVCKQSKEEYLARLALANEFSKK